MPARYLASFRCQDACGTITTERVVDGAPVYRCPGCDSEWLETSELGTIGDDSLTSEATQ